MDTRRYLVVATAASTLIFTAPVVAHAQTAPPAPVPVPAPAQVADRDGYFTSGDNLGTQIYYRAQTIPNARGNVILVHGVGEHSGRYDGVANALLAAGYNVYRLDHRGHGRSADSGIGVRGHLDDMHLVVSDLDRVVDMAKGENPQVPTFLLGHSMGGFVSQFYGIREPGKVAGIVINGAGVPFNLSGVNNPGHFITPDAITDFQRGLPPTSSEFLGAAQLTTFNAHLLQQSSHGLFHEHTHFPSPPGSELLRAPNVLPPGTITMPENLADYYADPLVAKEISVGTYQQLMFAMVYNSLLADKFTTPTLIMHGNRDGLVPSYFSQDWFNAISSQDKQLEFWEGQAHEVFNDPAAAEAMRMVIDWLNARS